MSALQFFANQIEVLSLIRRFAKSRQLGGYVTSPRLFIPFDPIGDTEVLMRDRFPRVVLVPQTDVSPQFISDTEAIAMHKGMIQVKPGLLREHNNVDILEMTTFETQDYEGLPFRPTYWLREFKKQLKSDGTLTFGMTAYGVADGCPGNSFSDLGYSAGAYELIRSGIRCMQYKTNTSFFLPTDYTGPSNAKVAS